jgi:hypothetical protein
LALTTVFGLFELKDFLKDKMKKWSYEIFVNNAVLLIFVGVLMFGTTCLYVLARDVYFFGVKPERIKTALYLPDDVFAANDWLKGQKDDGLVLASPLMSIFVPGFSGHPIYAAHGHETLFFYSKIVFVHWVYIDNANDDNKKLFLTKNNIKYLMHTDYEKEMGTFDPSTKDYLELVFDQPESKVYKVIY